MKIAIQICLMIFYNLSLGNEIILNKNHTTIEVTRIEDTTYFYVNSDNNYFVNPECYSWGISPDSLFNLKPVGDYPDYVGCITAGDSLQNVQFDFIPMKLREYIDVIQPLFDPEKFNVESLNIKIEELDTMISLKSKEEFLNFEKNFPKFKYFYYRV